MNERNTDLAASAPNQRVRRAEPRKLSEEAAAARQRARDRAGDEGLPRSSGAPKRRGAS